jgi:hypothetical protein
LPWAISRSAVFSLRMICSAVCLVGFMVKSPAHSDRLRTLIHPGPIKGVTSPTASQRSSRGDLHSLGIRLRARASATSLQVVTISILLESTGGGLNQSTTRFPTLTKYICHNLNSSWGVNLAGSSRFKILSMRPYSRYWVTSRSKLIGVRRALGWPCMGV